MNLRLSVVASWVVVVSFACSHQPDPPSPWVAPQHPVPALRVVETELADVAAIERLVDGLAMLGAGEDGVAALLQLGRQMPAERLARDPAARRWLMVAVYRGVQGGGLADRFDTVRGLVDALQIAAPDSAETRFCRAYLRFVLLQDDGERLQAGALDRAIVADLGRELAGLADPALDFAGPAGWDVARIARERQRVEALLAAWPATAPVATAAATDATPVQAPAAASGSAP